MAKRLRFDVLTLAAGPVDEIARRWRDVEALGFQGGWLADTLSLPGIADYEPWSLLGFLASSTSTLRIGTLVTQITFRHPALLAAEALTLDHISEGRLDLGIGAGDHVADSEAVGEEPWALAERIGRFEEQLSILDRALRGEPVDHAGRYYRAKGVQLVGPRQSPRPPLVIAGQQPATLRLVARFADVWTTLGGQPLTKTGQQPLPIDDAVERTREQVRVLEDYCRAAGRNPDAIRKSVLPYRSELDPLSSLDAFDEFVGRYSKLGFDQFIFYWPPVANLRQRVPISANQQAALERVARERFSTSAV